MLKIVFDTNVIVSAALYQTSLPALLLSLALEHKLRIFVSPALLNEYGEVLKRPRFKLTQEEITELMDKINEKAVIIMPTQKLAVFKEDESDNRILECATKAKADFIITGNTKHFSFKTFRGCKIVTPREFINEISEF
jgi:putative PIN family toxin of toxin-antitoxin system